MPRPVIPLATAKRHLRVEHDLDDATIQLYLSAAIDRTLQEIGLAGELDDLRAEAFTACEIFFRIPIHSVVSVSRNGDALNPTDWILSGNAERGQRLTINEAARIDGASYVITYHPGWQMPPEWFQLAALFLVAHYYENRSSAVIGQGIVSVEVPHGFAHLCRPHRRIYFA